MTSRRVHDGSRSSKKEAELDSGTKEEGGNGCNHIQAVSGVLTRSQSVNKQSKGTKVAEIANTETSFYHSASVCSRASKGQDGYKSSSIDSSITLKTISTGSGKRVDSEVLLLYKQYELRA
jgi:hypothetical protein